MNNKEGIKSLLAPDKMIFLITTGTDGRPDVRAMAPAQCEEVKTVWMLTCKQSEKYSQLRQNPQCLLYATVSEDSQEYLELRLWGRIELLDDAATRTKIWRDDYAIYFPGGKDDPNLCVLKFTADSGTVQTQTGKEKIIF